THEAYVHPNSIGQAEILESPIETWAEADRVFVSRWMRDIDAPPFWRQALKKLGKVDRWQICQFIPPSSVIIDVGVAPVEAGSTVEHHDGGVRGFVIDALTPENEASTHYFWGMARNFAIHDGGVGTRLRRQQGSVFQEDVEILEAQQRSIEANPGLKLRAFNIDSGGVRARMVIDSLRNAASA
ncbi:MAG TPA: aromatic ring-hydroxylating dioxygenase subunit alpha, partial [Stellaceae bacterium]|nr:aromatic ring-hydroxylating dioxygenase subunit alpha [Stellaceae bacterium]